MPPKQREDKRSSTRAVRFGIERRALRDEQLRKCGLVRISGLVQRRRAAIVAFIDVRPCGQQCRDEGQTALPIRLTARLSSVLPLVPRSLARRGFRRKISSKAAASPDCSAANAAMKGSLVISPGLALSRFTRLTKSFQDSKPCSLA
jgi:hypothetical protein